MHAMLGALKRKERTMKKAKQVKMAVVEQTPVPCFRCGSTDLIQVAAKCSDGCRVTRGGKTSWGYVPLSLGLGENGDYVEFTYCRKCGQMQNAEFKV
jgi:hypothetical protein